MNRDIPKIIFIVVVISAFISCSEENNNSLLTNGAVLSFSPIQAGGVFTTLPANGLGSWFSMEVNNGIHTVVPINSLNGLILGVNQLANTVQPPDGEIDEPWMFFGNVGAHQTLVASTLLSAENDNAMIDFSGWNVTWNANPEIDLSTGAWNGNADGVAILNCNGACDGGSSYVLTYSATVSSDEPSGYSNTRYSLHLEGIISLL